MVFNPFKVSFTTKGSQLSVVDPGATRNILTGTVNGDGSFSVVSPNSPQAILALYSDMTITKAIYFMRMDGKFNSPVSAQGTFVMIGLGSVTGCIANFTFSVTFDTPIGP